MATVMRWGTSDGEKGRCDAKCHEAREPECVCMCGGRFHGVAHQEGGLEKALEDLWHEVWEAAQKRAKEEGVSLEAMPVQLHLLG